ncbi:unnamed protein product, partial [Mesorhabditis spiculigera]
MDKPDILPELMNSMDLGLDGDDDFSVNGRSKRLEFFQSLPSVVTRTLFSHLGRDLIKFAQTSRKNWELVCTSRRQFSTVRLMGCDVCLLEHCGFERSLHDKRFWGPLLHGAEVTTLHPGLPGNCDFPGLRADVLALQWPHFWTAAELESYKPLSVKFKEILLSDPTREEISEDVINFIRDSAEQIAYEIPPVEQKRMLCRRFKNTRVRFRYVWSFGRGFHAYHKRLIDEWLAYKRDLFLITSCAQWRDIDNHADDWKNTFVGYDVQFIENRLAVITRSDGENRDFRPSDGRFSIKTRDYPAFCSARRAGFLAC